MRKSFSALIIILVSCTTKEPAPIPVVTDYFPLKNGSYQIFSVDSVVLSQNIETEYAYELKTEITDSIPASDGSVTYVIHRSKRTTASSQWTSLETWSARANSIQAVVNEGNISFVKISGPLGDGKTWNGNAFNILGGTEKCLNGTSYSCDNYTIASFAKPYTSDSSQNFENTLTVIENDNEDLIVEFDKRSEIYGKGIGLIYREITILDYCTDQNCLGTQFVDRGIKYKQTLTSYAGY